MTHHPYGAFCEDFYVNMRLGSQLTLPHNRETVLHLFERVQKCYPSMSRFRKSDNGEFNLEEDRGSNAYRWISLEQKRLSSGHVNPTTFDESLKLHSLLLENAPHHLGISPIEIDYLDVLFGFDGHAVESPEDLLDLLAGDRVGREVTLRVRRGSAVTDLTVTVGERHTH